jgi:hypothetical protein
MAREINLPSPATYVQDFGLNVSPAPIQRNKRVVILGTAEDGPMYEPIQIEKPEDAEFVWGRLGAGDLSPALAVLQRQCIAVRYKTVCIRAQYGRPCACRWSVPGRQGC